MDWATAYARQASSDLDARDWLLAARPPLPQCHELHFFQMAMEKLCKAHLIDSGSSVPADLQTSHAYIATPFRVIAKQMLMRQTGARSDGWLLEAIATLARKIELLAPAVDAGGTHPSNCEYPWEGPDGVVVTPVDYDFGLDLVNQRAATTMIKLARIRLSEILGGEDD